MKMKKRKFNIYFNFLILVFLSLFLYQNSIAKDNCVKFLDDLDNNFDKYIPNDYPRYLYNDFGFDFKFEWDDLNKKWILAKDDDGYPIIGRIIDEENIGKIKRGDVVISANGKDIREYDLIPKETYLEENIVITNTINAVNEDGKNIITSGPIPVATPFPPLNLL